MPGKTDRPIIKPTPTEEKIWEHIRPGKIGGMIRQGSARFPHDMFPCCYGPRDKTNLNHWDCKMKGGPRAYTLADFLEKAGFTDLKFWTHNNGRKFAEELQAAGVLAAMPDDTSAVWRALVRSIHPLSSPTTLVSCKSPCLA